LLRPAFLEAAKTQRHIDRIETVLICFGGADSKNLTQQTLETVLKYKEFKKVIVITGSAYLFKEQLDITVKSDERAKHYHSVGEQEMAGFLLKSDLAIVPASGILLEALACGCRVISGMYADNQKFLYEE